jgi:ferric-dicitrate binding protein FerR (iron transport regulator)
MNPRPPKDDFYNAWLLETENERRRFSFPVWAAWAVVACVLAGLVVWGTRKPKRMEFPAEFARIESIVGHVAIVRSEGEFMVAVGQVIGSGTELRTVGEESRAVVQLHDGTRLALDVDTRVTLFEDNPDAAVDKVGRRVVLTEGFLSADVARQPEGRPMRFRTPKAELVASEAKFQLSGAAETTYVGTSAGSVQVTGNWSRTSAVVKAGFETAIDDLHRPVVRPRPAALLTPRLRLEGFYAAALSHDGRTLAATKFSGGEIQWWDIETAKMVHAQPAQRSQVRALAFSLDDSELASGDADGQVTIWNRLDTEPKRTFAADGPWISDVAAASGGWGILSGTEGSEERKMWVRNSVGEAAGSRYTFAAERWAFSENGAKFAYYDRKYKFAVHDLNGGGSSHFPMPVGDDVFSMALSPDGRRLAADGSSGRIVVRNSSLLDASVGRQVEWRFARLGGRAFGMAFSPDNRLLAAGHQDGTIRLWRIADGTQLAASAGGPARHRAAAFTPDGKRLMTREMRLAADGERHDGAVTVWDIPELPDESRL